MTKVEEQHSYSQNGGNTWLRKKLRKSLQGSLHKSHKEKESKYITFY